MTYQTLLQICAKLPPAKCGVGDFANNLAEVIGDRLVVKNYAIDQLQDKSNRERSRILVQEIDRSCSGAPTLLLHFSGYSYARWGLCYWLLDALEQFLNAEKSSKLITVFHELWATGPVTSSAFWVNGLQRRIAKRLYALSHHRRFSRVKSLHEVNQELRRPLDYVDDTVSVMPVFSSLGECQDPTAWSSRKPEMVLILPPSLGSTNAKTFWDEWDSVCNLLQVKVTHVIGRVTTLPKDSRIVDHGFVTAEFAHELLCQVRYSLFQYFPGYYAKSSIFAALAAHGIPVMTVGSVGSELDGLVCGVNYLSASRKNVSDDWLQQVGSRLFDWYQSHDRECYAASIVRLASTMQGQSSCG